MTEKKKYYIQIEAVNLDSFVYDTDDISTIRGGSLLLRNAVKFTDLKIHPNTNSDLTSLLDPITTGGSIGIYKTKKKYESEEQIKTIVNKALNFAREYTKNEASFIGAAVEESGDFKEDKEKLQNKIRLQQFKQPTVILPKKEVDYKEKPYCNWDGVRPAMHYDKIKKDLSRITYIRREKMGRNLKKDYINREILNNKKSLIYTWDFEQLVKDQPHDITDVLRGKKAFIYFDGNKFTKLKNKNCVNPDDYRNFENALDSGRNKIIKEFILNYMDKNCFIYNDNNENKCRIEITLWGGDEASVALPAWLGWDFMWHFFENCDKMNFGSMPLTHSFGVVFCNHKAPILQVKRFASQLVDMAKKQLGSDPPDKHEKGNAMHYLILESIDILQGGVQEFTNTFYKNKIFDDLLITKENFCDVTVTILAFKNNFPRTKLYQIMDELRKCNLKGVEKHFQFVLDNVEMPPVDKRIIKNTRDKIINDHEYKWLYWIADLWDYVPKEGE